MFTEDVDSYFPPQPVIQPLPSSDTSSALALYEDELPQKHRSRYHHPPTPPFPPSQTPQPPHKTTNNSQAHKHESKTKPSRQAYSRFMGRLHDEYERDDRHSHSRSRSDSSSSSSLPAILRLLAQETARADTAERELAKDADALLTRVRDAKIAKDRSDSELVRVKEELSLYKLQLDVAQNEINRAQIIVAEVERARIEAEDRGTRDRDRIRKLLTERAVDIAREEGRREGWKQGLESGRWAAWSSLEGGLRTMAHEARENGRVLRSSQASSSSHSRTRSSSSTSRTDTRETGRGQGRGATHRPALPAPIPIRPNSQRVPQRPVYNSAPASAPIHPENISVHARTGSQPRSQSRASEPRVPSPAQTQYSRGRTRSPSLARSHRSHRSVVFPPDGYIPTLGPDSLITLPPPHELSQPVDFGPEEQSEPGDAMTDGGRESRAGRVPEVDDKRLPRAKEYSHQSSSALRSENTPGYDEVFRARSRSGRTATAMSATSRGSTHISQYDLVSPPRDHDRERDWIRRRNAINLGERNGSERGRNTSAHGTRTETRGRTQPEQIVEEWRSANSDIVETPTPSNPHISERSSNTGPSRPQNNGGKAIQGILVNNGATNSPAMRSIRINEETRPSKDSMAHNAFRSLGSGYGGPSTYARNIYQNVDTSSHRTQTPQHPPEDSHGAESPYMEKHTRVRRPGDGPQRSLSSATVIGIEVEPPSRSPTNTSEGTVVDPILLTPDHANRPTPLPQNVALEPHETSYGTHQNQGKNPANVAWSDNKFPPGFVPLSPIPTLTNFNPDDHDHHRMHEQFRDAGYQIYAGAAFIPPPPVVAAGPVSGHKPSNDPNPNSVLFSGTQRASTPSDVSRDPPSREAPRRRVTAFDSSPAPLNRPFSIFSDT
ncbi:hypothetical protein BDZ94DRAFT_1321786 [Collybia nuda]|uniref:Uncharacterized protein n=1 Tax=Collybia nuda TaxID=64659 RepID=A0A9P5Y690_9AGAR|nr:hypothetical protein BDZ94DRAFT_1321786 [Collybia nuda]